MMCEPMPVAIAMALNTGIDDRALTQFIEKCSSFLFVVLKISCSRIITLLERHPPHIRAWGSPGEVRLRL